MASEIAIPRLPGDSGSDSRTFLPEAVMVEGDGTTLAP